MLRFRLISRGAEPDPPHRLPADRFVVFISDECSTGQALFVCFRLACPDFFPELLHSRLSTRTERPIQLLFFFFFFFFHRLSLARSDARQVPAIHPSEIYSIPNPGSSEPGGDPPPSQSSALEPEIFTNESTSTRHPRSKRSRRSITSTIASGPRLFICVSVFYKSDIKKKPLYFGGTRLDGCARPVPDLGLRQKRRTHAASLPVSPVNVKLLYIICILLFFYTCKE